MAGQMQMPTREKLTERAQANADLYTNKDVDAIMAKYTDDLKYTDIALGLHKASKPTLRDLLTRLFASIDDLKMTPLTLNLALPVTTAEPEPIMVFTEYKMTGKYVKDVKEIGVKAEGQRIAWVGGTFTTLAEDMVHAVEIRHYGKYYFEEDIPDIF